MMYKYLKLEEDATEIVHSNIIMKENGREQIIVHFERPSEERCFDIARCEIPGCKWMVREGFSDSEILKFEQLIQRECKNIFKIARAKEIIRLNIE